MAGFYEALLRADEERFPDAPSAPEAPSDHEDPSRDLAAVGAMLRRLEDRVETEISDEYDESFERYASLQVSLGAIEDRLDDREREQRAASEDLVALIERVASEVSALGGRLDYELPLLRSELLAAVERGAEADAAPEARKRGIAGFLRRPATAGSGS